MTSTNETKFDILKTLNSDLALRIHKNLNPKRKFGSEDYNLIYVYDSYFSDNMSNIQKREIYREKERSLVKSSRNTTRSHREDIEFEIACTRREIALLTRRIDELTTILKILEPEYNKAVFRE